MATEVFLAKMSDFMEEGVIHAWLANEGDRVEEGQPLLEVETDKVVAELESPATGYLKGIRQGAQAGATVRVGETIAYIVATTDEQVEQLPPL